MKHLNPLRTLRLLTALSAASAPVYVPLLVGTSTSMVACSTVHAQSPSGGNLPPLPPAAQAFTPPSTVTATPSGVTLPPAGVTMPNAAMAPDSLAFAKELLSKAQTALNEGRQQVALQTFAQAQLIGPTTAEWNAELQKARQAFQAKGVAPNMIDNAVRMAQAATLPTSNALRNGAPALMPAANTLRPNSPAAMPPTLPPLAGLPSTSMPTTAPNPLRDQAAALTAQAKLAMDRGDLNSARQLIGQANSLRVPDKDFAPGQTKPWEVELALKGREGLQNGVVPASANLPLPSSTVQNASATMPAASIGSVQPGVYSPQADGSRVAPASGVLSSYDADTNGNDLFQQGMSALSSGDRAAALEKFKGAWQKKSDLDPATLGQLKDKLTLLNQPRNSGEPESINALSVEGREAQMKRQRLFSEVTGEIADAERLAAANEPLEALDKLRTLRQRVTQADTDSANRKNMLAMVDKVSQNIEAWVEQNKVAIELDQRNKQIENRMQVEAATQAKTDAQVQTLVDQYNDLIDSRRFPEAIEVAKKISNLKPGSEIAAVMMTKAKIQARVEEYELIRGLKEENFTKSMLEVDRSSIPTDDTKPLSFPSLQEWEVINGRLKKGESVRMLPSEKRIREALAEPFSASFDKRPLSDAMKTIGEMFGIPIDIDERSIQEEGITTDQPVSLDLQGNSIQLKSALNQMLEKLNLTYAVKNETLTIQSRRFTQRETFVETYNVKDLVIPIPNFVSDYNTGMAGALQAAYQAQTSFVAATVEGQSNAVNASRVASIDPKNSIMTQVASMPALNGISPSLAGAIPGASMGGIQGSQTGFGGGAIANYNDLLNLIRSTITPDAWDVNGGTSTMTEFRQNLSLVVSAPQETHEAIADLLRNLRALQNLQVTIEVRFIQLQDTFFEQIGVDFDMSIDDNVTQLPADDSGRAVSVGLTGETTATGPVFSGDLDFKLNNNFAAAPPFGAPDINQATSFGVAILSDLELFFFLQASQGNSRQNVLNAPKVTMFDGQIASVNDFAQRPFVISFEPVVGDFAVAQRPIVVVLNEGTQMNVQSVVSQDRRFVRMTLVPQFTRLESTDRQFTFTGRRTTRTGTSILNPNGTPTNNRNNEEAIIEGTTVQQPTFGVTSVSTTVSVPDGGTILLGGIKRLREGRVERGTPILSKIPYLNRLFKKDAIGRETNTLMMTVSPRIIIPEEEEERLGVTTNRP